MDLDMPMMKLSLGDAAASSPPDGPYNMVWFWGRQQSERTVLARLTATKFNACCVSAPRLAPSMETSNEIAAMLRDNPGIAVMVVDIPTCGGHAQQVPHMRYQHQSDAASIEAEAAMRDLTCCFQELAQGLTRNEDGSLYPITPIIIVVFADVPPKAEWVGTTSCKVAKIIM